MITSNSHHCFTLYVGINNIASDIIEPCESYPLELHYNLGGFYMNPSTFGGLFNETGVSASVLLVRGLHADGTIAVYDDYEEELTFRGSTYMLGIVAALEIKIQMYDPTQ